MAEKLTSVEKWINEVRLLRREMAALEEENEHLRKVLRGVFGMVAGLKKFETRYPHIMAMTRECLKESGE